MFHAEKDVLYDSSFPYLTPSLVFFCLFFLRLIHASRPYLASLFRAVIGSIIWAYLIGKISTLMHFLSRTNLEHHQMMDSLEEFIRDKKLDDKLAHRLRRYFVKRQSLDRMETYQVLLNHMSPTLRGDVANALTGPWLSKVNWLRNAERAFVTSLAMLMRPEIYPPMEMISGETFHVVVRGVVIKDMQVMCSGMIWGFDMILFNKSLRRMRPAIALTYVEVLELRRMDLVNLLARFPKANKRVRKSVIWLAFKRKFLAHAREIEMLTSQIGKLLVKEVGSRERVRLNFHKYDRDGDGWINAVEFSNCMADLGFEARSDVIENLMVRFDADNDGKISLAEFFSFFDTYSKESSRLLHINQKQGMFSITKTIGHHVVDAQHGLLDDNGKKVAGDDDGPPGKLSSFYKHKDTDTTKESTSLLSSMSVAEKAALMRTSTMSNGSISAVHAFSDHDLVLNLHSNQATHSLQIEEIQKTIMSQNEILNHKLAEISEKLGMRAAAVNQ